MYSYKIFIFFPFPILLILFSSCCFSFRRVCNVQRKNFQLLVSIISQNYSLFHFLYHYFILIKEKLISHIIFFIFIPRIVKISSLSGKIFVYEFIVWQFCSVAVLDNQAIIVFGLITIPFWTKLMLIAVTDSDVIFSIIFQFKLYIYISFPHFKNNCFLKSRNLNLEKPFLTIVLFLFGTKRNISRNKQPFLSSSSPHLIQSLT